MNLLSDTHSFLWFIAGDERLSAVARAVIEDDDNELFLSVASLWEMAIKVSLEKLTFNQPFESFLAQQLAENGVELIGIKLAHVVRVADMPFHHRDPFDRLIIAQAQVEKLPLLSGVGQFLAKQGNQ